MAITELGPITEIGVRVRGDFWDVVTMRDGEIYWASAEVSGRGDLRLTKSEAMTEARDLFNDTPTAKRLVVENKREGTIETIRAKKETIRWK